MIKFFIQGDRESWGVDFDEFLLYNVNMVNVTFLPKLEGKRTFEFEIALKTKSDEVSFAVRKFLEFSNFSVNSRISIIVKGDKEA